MFQRDLEGFQIGLGLIDDFGHGLVLDLKLFVKMICYVESIGRPPFLTGEDTGIEKCLVL
jgi:hypothetical protein